MIKIKDIHHFKETCHVYAIVFQKGNPPGGPIAIATALRLHDWF